MAKNTPDIPRGEAALTIVAQGARFEGTLDCRGVIKVEGIVVGTVRADRQVLVARGGLIEGDVQSREAVIGGEVRGGVQASERIEIQEGAVVHGDIVTKRLAVVEGGEVNGNITMGEPAAGARSADSVSTSAAVVA